LLRALGKGGVRDDAEDDCLLLRTYACRPRVLLAFSSGLRCSILKNVMEVGLESVD
jgi:hypothetical protein